MDTYTVLAAYYIGTPDHTVEELDVQADSHEEAKAKAIAELDEHYLSGYTITEVIRRMGLY